MPIVRLAPLHHAMPEFAAPVAKRAGGLTMREVYPVASAAWAGMVLLVAASCALDPARAGPPFQTDDPEPTDFGKLELNLYSDATRADHSTAGTVIGIEANYGALPNLQISLALPLDSQPTDGDEASFGFGTAAVGVKYRFIEEDEGGWRPQVAFYPSVELPLHASKDTPTREFLPLWAEKNLGPWTVFGGGGYWNNPGAENQNYWFFGSGVTRSLTPWMSVGVELFHQTPDTVGGEGATGTNVGVIFNLSNQLSIMASFGGGIENAATTNQYSYFTALRWTTD